MLLEEASCELVAGEATITCHLGVQIADISTTHISKPYLTNILRVRSPTVWYAHHLTEYQLRCEINKSIINYLYLSICVVLYPFGQYI